MKAAGHAAGEAAGGTTNRRFRRVSCLAVLLLIAVAAACDPEPPPPSQAQMDVSITASHALVVVGGQVTYDVSTTNSGQGPAAQAVVNVVWPTDLSYTSATPSQGSCIPTAGGVVCNLGQVAVDGTASVSIVATAEQPGLVTTSVDSFGGDAQPHDTATTTVGIIEAPTADLSDTFTRIDSLSLGSAETGQQWVVPLGGWGVENGRAMALWGGYHLVVGEGGAPNGTFEATVPELGSEFWAVLRYTDAANYWRFGRTSDGNYVLQRISNGVVAPSDATTLAVVTPAAGDTISCRMSSLSLRCAVNDTPVVITHHAFNQAATQFGVASFSVEEGFQATRFDDVAFTALGPVPQLEITATASSSAVVVGEQVSYTLTMDNVGNAAADAVRVEDVLPAAVTFDSAVPSQGDCGADAGNVTCNLGPILAGGAATVVITGTAQSPGIATNHATVFVDVPPDPEAHDVTTTTIGVLAEPLAGDLGDTFTRSDAGLLGTAETGQPWTTVFGGWGISQLQAAPTSADYSMAIADGGSGFGTFDVDVPVISSEFWVILRASDENSFWRFGRWGNSDYLLQKIAADILVPAEVTTLAPTTPAPGDHIGCDLTPTAITCSVNGTPVLTTADGFNETASFYGVAAFESTGVPTVRFDNLSFDQSDPTPALHLEMTPSTNPVEFDEEFTYTVLVTNNGDASATDVSLVDTLPNGVTLESVAASQGVCTPSAGTVSCDLGPMAIMATVSVELTVTGSTEGMAENTATVHLGTSADPAHDTATYGVMVLDEVFAGTVLDTFERPDSPDLGTADTGQTWLTHLGTFGIEDNRAVPTTLGNSFTTLDAGAAFGNFDVAVGQVSSEFWVVFHYTDPLNYWRFGRYDDGDYVLEMVENGSRLQINGPFALRPLTPRDNDFIRVVLTSDDGINVFVNGFWVVGTGTLFNINATRLGFSTVTGAGDPVQFTHVAWRPFGPGFPEPQL